MYALVDSHTGEVLRKGGKSLRAVAERKNQAYGAVRYVVRCV